MLSKIIDYIRHSYHRPSAKLEHLFVLVFSFFLNRKTFLFSEKLFLLKFPPFSMIYFNFLGRFFYTMINSIMVILFGKFADQALSIETDHKDFPKKKKIGDNFIPWPVQAMHHDESTKELNDDDFKKILDSYNKSVSDLQKKNFKDSPWWEELRKEFRKTFIENENKLNKDNLINFRNDIDSKAAILKDQNIAISKKNSKLMNKINAAFLASLYHKYSEVVDLNILRSVSDSLAGNNRCVNYRGQRLNHRILRYTYYLSQLKNNLDFKKNDRITICDIGGGYGGLLRLLKHFYKKSCCILVELPETCLLASYFLKKNFPEKNFLLYSDIQKEISFEDYDFVIIPQSKIESLPSKSIDLVINTSSLSEMDNETQNFYVNQIERLTNKYFYSVNRHKYKMHKYDAQGFYNLDFKNRWDSIIYKFTHTYQLEFLGKKIDN